MINPDSSPVGKLTLEEAVAFCAKPDLEVCKAEWEWAFTAQGKPIPETWENLSDDKKQNVITECQRYCAELNTVRLLTKAIRIED